MNLANTPKLRRACFEDCDLGSLDLSQSPALEDLRGAMNQYRTNEFGHTGRRVWHICVRDNPQLTDQALFADLSPMPNLSELFICNDNQAGALRLPASSPSQGCIQVTELALENNQLDVSQVDGLLTTLSRTAACQIREYHLWGTALSPTAIDRVFADAVTTGVRRGPIWSPNRGTAASAGDRDVLAERQWEINF